MALTKKKSRPIVVNDECYRFQISTTKVDKDWNFTLNLTIQHEEKKGSVLQIKGLVTRDFWLMFSELGNDWKKEDYPIVLPKHISKIINLSLKNGWLPKIKGPAYILKTENKVFFK